MDYERKYKDALERARQFCEHPLQEDSSNIVEYIFPELKESEDEKIRKWLISQLKIKSDDTNSDLNIMIDKAISWLEKQGEPIDNDMVEALRTEYEKGKADAFTEMEKSWSEEDKNFMYDTLSNLTELKDRYGKDYGNVGKCMDWIKSLKQRIGG